MKNKLHIQEFIEQHSDWEQILQEKPYCLIISRAKFGSRNLIMLKYNQVESDFNEILCRECRGLILDEDTFKPVCVPFYKFGNVNEGSWVEQIDWNKSPYILDKIDGSLIKIVNLDGQLLISTNGTILAEMAPIAEQIGCPFANYKELAINAIENQMNDFHDQQKECCKTFANSLEWFKSIIKPDYTYMFELTSRWNRIVVPAGKPKLWFIGVRDNKTLNEEFIFDNQLSKIFDTPKLHKFSTFEECIETAKNLPWDSEGYVITSKDFKRNKAKSLGYLSCHHLKNNGVMSYERAVELIQLNEVDEVLSYFPEFKNELLDVKNRYEQLISRLEAAYDNFNKFCLDMETRKDKAVWIQKNFEIPAVGFCLLDKNISSVKDWILNIPAKKLVRYLGFKNN